MSEGDGNTAVSTQIVSTFMWGGVGGGSLAQSNFTSNPNFTLVKEATCSELPLQKVNCKITSYH